MDSQPVSLSQQIETYIENAQINIVRSDIIWTEYPEYHTIGEYNPDMGREFEALFNTYTEIITQLQTNRSIPPYLVSQFQIYNILLIRRRDEWHYRYQHRTGPSQPNYIEPFRVDLQDDLMAHLAIYIDAQGSPPLMGERDIRKLPLPPHMGRELRSDYTRQAIPIHDPETRQIANMPVDTRYQHEIDRIIQTQRTTPRLLNAAATPALPPPAVVHRNVHSIREGNTDDGNFDCCICLEEDIDPATLDRPHLTTSCNHRYHWNCLRSWISSRSGAPFCPMCKGTITPGYQFD